MSDARGFWFDFDGTQRKLLEKRKEEKMSKNSFIQWIEDEAKAYERRNNMAKATTPKAEMTLDEKQKKGLLDIFNAGNDFLQSYRESGIKYVTAWEMEQLLDLIDDMKELYGISPKISAEADREGDHFPTHWGDHVFSDDPRAWKRKGD